MEHGAAARIGRAAPRLLLVCVLAATGCANAGHRYAGHSHPGHPGHPGAYRVAEARPDLRAPGALAGGLAGAALGAGLDHRNRGRGALLGGLGGLIVGAVFADQIAHYDARHHWHEAREHGPWCESEHTWPDDDGPGYDAPPPDDAPSLGLLEVLFDPGRAKLTRGAESRLRLLARDLRDRPDLELLLRGHSDAREPNGFDLSERRARTVRAFLVENGLPARRIAWVGFGDAQPVASSETGEGRQRNRRVEIVLREPDPDLYS